jgi:hypothetical protein
MPHRGQPVAVLAAVACIPQRQIKRHLPSLPLQQEQMVIGVSGCNDAAKEVVPSDRALYSSRMA